MRTHRAVSMMFLATVLFAAACAVPRSATGEAPEEARTQPPSSRITIGSLQIVDLLPGTQTPGTAPLRHLVSPGLSVVNDAGQRVPVVAESVPSIDNGLWRLHPDGRMETTWKVRPNARWHDGAAITSDDLLFSARLAQDRDLPGFGHLAFGSVDQIAAPDAQTVVVTWRQPYIRADAMFSALEQGAMALPLPRHRLEADYRERKAAFAELPFWTSEFVGTGPFRVQEWLGGTGVLLEAFPDYALGRPRLSQIEVRFITDPTTLIANLLAGSVDLTIAAFRSIEPGLVLRDQWKEGTVSFVSGRWQALFPQLVNPRPEWVADVRLRKALMHAIDRQVMSDTLQAGIGSVAHGLLSPDEPEYRDIEGRIVRYDYDPRKATQMIQALGYEKGADAVFRDQAGRPMEVEVWAVAGAFPFALAVADSLQRIGVDAAPVVYPAQRIGDWPYEATFPGFRIFTAPAEPSALTNFHSSKARLPENNFQVPGGTNWSRYVSPELDALIDRYFVTVRAADRTKVLGDILQHMSERLNVMGLVHTSIGDGVANRLLNVSIQRASSATITWNAHQWAVRG